MIKILVLFFILNFYQVGCESNANKSIVVIGAGPSGIAAATKLLKNGFTNLKILEAENRIGGRVNSVKFGDAYVDLGAQWCHGEKDNIVYSLVKDLDILRHLNISFQLMSSDGQYVDKELTKEFFKFIQSVDASVGEKKNCENVWSTGECARLNFNSTFLEKYKADPKRLRILENALEWLEAYVNSYDATLTWNDLYIKSDYKRCEGDLDLSWYGRGYKTVLEVMMQKYPDPKNALPIDDKVLLNKEVIQISNWNGDGKVKIELSDGSDLECDVVIFTPSAGVLKATYKSMFVPPLPKEKAHAIENVGFGAVLKGSIHFPARWWTLDNIWYKTMWLTADKNKMQRECASCVTKSGKLWLTNLVGFNPSENNPNVLNYWFAGSAVPEIEQLSDDDIISGIMYALKKFFGKVFTITQPDEMIHSAWYTNPHFRGTYSYESTEGHRRGEGKYPAKLAAPLLRANGEPSVLFAGEATHSYYFSTVHGAIESGYREADRIINHKV